MKPTVQDALSEANALIEAMDRVRANVPADRLDAFEREYSEATTLFDALVVAAIGTGLRKRRSMLTVSK